MEIDAQGAKNKILNVGVLIVAVVVGLYIYGKQAKKIESLKEQTATEEKKNDVLKDLAGLQQQVKNMETVLPPSDAGNVMTTISMIAQTHGVKIVSFRPGVEQRLPDYVKSPYSLELNVSDYHKLGKFIGNVESANQVFIVDNVTIRPTFAQSGKKEALVVTLTITTVSAAK